jgi:hypothetical protein
LEEARVAKKALPSGFEKRGTYLKAAALAARDFDATVRLSSDSRQISPGLLGSLSSKRREAARWITAAFLDEELESIGSRLGFFSWQLLKIIASAPLEDPIKSAYRRRGEELHQKLLQLKSNDKSALQILESETWKASLERIETPLAQSASLRKNLLRDIHFFVEVPEGLAITEKPERRWRLIRDRLIVYFLPRSTHAERLQRRQEHRERLHEAFRRIAGGDYDGAGALLIAN